MDFGPHQAGVATCRAYQSVQVVGFDEVKVHHGQVAQPGCRKTHNDIEADATGAYYQNSPSYEVGLYLLTPGAHRSDLAVSGLWRGLDCVVPRYRKLVSDNPNVRGVSAVYLSADSDVPMTRGPCAVPCGKGHADQGEPCDFTDEVGVTGLAITVWPAHRLPSTSSGVAVE